MRKRGNLVVNNIQQQSTYLQDTGVSDVYVVDFLEPIIGYTEGLQVSFMADNANSGPSTLNVNSLGPQDIRKNVVVPLVLGDILANQIITVVYDGANFQMVGGSAGVSGFSGISGSNPGASGYSGYTGVSGYSGFGSIGADGASGYSGYTGTSGYSGYSSQSGFSGQSGTSGYSGYSGRSGYSAYSGQSGYSAYSGLVGISGYSGYTADPSLYWSKTGDAGTVATVNFLGTTDNIGLMFRVNNIQAGYLNVIRNNTSFGYQSLVSNTTGQSNVAMGYQAMTSNVNGTQSVAIGHQALALGTGVGQTVAVGFQALYSQAGGSANTAAGYQALRTLTTTSGNTAFGYQALYFNAQNYNTAIGESAMFSNTTGYRCTAVGRRALTGNTTGTHNTSVGCYDVSGDQVMSTGHRNTNMGYNSLKFTNGDDNSAFGLGALGNTGPAVQTSSRNSGLGKECLFFLTSGNENSALGMNAGYANTSGSANIFLGYYAGKYNTTVSNQIFVNSLDRTTYARDKTDSPIYIEQDLTPLNQYIHFNGTLFAPYTANAVTQDVLMGQVLADGRVGHITIGAGLDLTAGELSATGSSVAGTWTPTLDNTTNITSSTAVISHYSQVGNQVTFSGSALIDTAAGGSIDTVLGISLPVASNFAAVTDATGVGTGISVGSYVSDIYIEANPTTDVIELKFKAIVATSGRIFFQGMYTVI